MLFRYLDHAGRTDRPASVKPYECNAAIERAVNVALACNRPLLVLGDSGGGKSTLARYLAWCLEYQYLEEVITSRTSAEDLKWRFDAVRRLAAAQAEESVGGEHDRKFVSPGVLWRAFAPTSASVLDKAGGAVALEMEGEPAAKPSRRQTVDDRLAAESRYGDKGTVVLLDEIDKADPDVPNDLLVTIDARWFDVPVLRVKVKASEDRRVLLMLTSNQERDLPRAFVRRCIVLALPPHDRGTRRKIAELHFPGVSADLLAKVEQVFGEIEAKAKDRAGTPPPSTAEFLDAVRACVELKLTADAPELVAAASVALWKRDKLPELSINAGGDAG